jgi:hypothetical protein
MKPQSLQRNRRDHFIPQSYLDGFIHPTRAGQDKPLWCLKHKKWKQRSTKAIGYRDGFYDYGISEVDGWESADSSFLEYENRYPHLRRELIASGFSGWVKHRDFLLRYLQMTRARSLLFFEQMYEQLQRQSIGTVKGMGPIAGGLTRVECDPVELPTHFLQTQTVRQMIEEIKRPISETWMGRFNWAIGIAPIGDFFVISEQPLVADGPAETIDKEMKDPNIRVHFPLCLQASLCGSLRPLPVETFIMTPDEMSNEWELQFKTAKEFIVSPLRLNL